MVGDNRESEGNELEMLEVWAVGNEWDIQAVESE